MNSVPDHTNRPTEPVLTRSPLPVGLTIAVVSIPLGVGIAAISPGVHPWSGILSAIVGGIVAGLISRSRTAISGPTAGMTAIVTSQLMILQSFEALLLAIVVAGVIQILLGLVRAGNTAAFFPSPVIRGLLFAVGIILVLKQIPHVLGHDTDPEGEMAFIQPDRENTFSELGALARDIHPGAASVGLLSIAVLLFWERNAMLQRMPVPGAVAVIGLGILLKLLLSRASNTWNIQTIHLTQFPRLDYSEGLSQIFSRPEFDSYLSPNVYWTGFLIAIVASLESLLSLESLGKLAPEQRRPDFNRELIAQGCSNITCGLIGGLPVTVELVRSAVAVQSGVRSRAAAVIHGVVLALLIPAMPAMVSHIPIASIAAILLVTGIKLCDLQVVRQLLRSGRHQLIPFAITVAAIILSDLLTGILLGLLISIVFILNSNFRRPVRRIVEKHLGGEVLVIELANQVSFLNRAVLEKTLREAPRGTHVLLDASGTDYIDSDVLNLIEEFRTVTAPRQGVQVSLRGFRQKYHLDDQIQYLDHATRELQQLLSPAEVLQLLIEGNERFRKGQRLTRDLSRQILATSQGQHPLAVILSCIDSRSPAELVFDLGLGDILNVRVAGNVTSPKVIGSLEYSCAVAGSRLILVMGHTRCGAVTAAVTEACSNIRISESTGCSNLEPILSEIQQAIDSNSCRLLDHMTIEETHALVDEVARKNVAWSVRQITAQSPKLGELIDNGRLAIVGVMYDVSTGEIAVLPEATVGLPATDGSRQPDSA